MVLRNYWWLLIWLFIVGGLSLVVTPQQEEIVLGRKCVRWHWFYAALLAAPYVIWAAWRSNKWGDTAMYQHIFREMPIGLDQMRAYIFGQTKAKTFLAFEYVFKSVVSDSYIVFFFFIALIQIFCIAYIYRKYSRSYWLSMFFFVASTDYMAWMHNGMRQFLAVTIIFFCIPLIVKKKYLLMCVIVLVASLVHSSALIFIPFVFIINGRAWNLRTIAFLASIMVAILFVDQVTGIISNAMVNTEYEGDIEYFSTTDDGTNLIRVLFYSVPAIMAFVFRPYIDSADDPMINICANMSIIAAGFYLFSSFTSGILMGALPIFFSLANYILIPWLISEVFEPSSAMLLNLSFVGVYLCFFYYQMGITWKLL